jgi:hypothetical protein
MKNKKIVVNISFVVIALSVIAIVLNLIQCAYFTQIVFSLAFISILLLITNIFLLKKKEEDFLKETNVSIGERKEDEVEKETEEDVENHCIELVDKIDKKLSFNDILKLKFEKLSSAIQLVAAVAYEVKGDKLQLAASYALLKSELKTELNIDGGMTGQVAKNALPIEIDVEDKIDLEIISGLGKSKPNYLYILPVQDKNKVIGVVELATFNKLTERRINFLIEAFQK